MERFFAGVLLICLLLWGASMLAQPDEAPPGPLESSHDGGPAPGVAPPGEALPPAPEADGDEADDEEDADEDAVEPKPEPKKRKKGRGG